MFGIRYIKAQPQVYFLLYKKGKVIREGAGTSFFYYSPTSSVVAVPLASVEVPFMFQESSADYQELTIQGQVTYRIADAHKLSALLNFTLGGGYRGYISDDPEKLPQRIINQVQVLVREKLQNLPIREAIKSSDKVSSEVFGLLKNRQVILELGLEVMDFSILALRPTPETARALETEIRELLLLEADEAVYNRRNAAVEQERAIKENELNTEIAIESKKKQIRETKIEADRSVQEKNQVLKEEGMQGKIILEERNKELVALTADNQKATADAKAYGVTAMMKSFEGIDPKVTQSLATVGMNPAQMIAVAFQNLAENAGKIGNLNLAPELLQELISTAKELKV